MSRKKDQDPLVKLHSRIAPLIIELQEVFAELGRQLRERNEREND